MSRKFLESDEVDSKIFEGRVLSLLGEIITELHNQHRKLEEMSYFPSDSERQGFRQMEEDLDDHEEFDDEVH